MNPDTQPPQPQNTPPQPADVGIPASPAQFSSDTSPLLQSSAPVTSTYASVADEVMKTKDDKPKSLLREALSTVGLIGSALLTALLLNLFVFQSYEVDGQSMEPTLQNQDRLIIYKLDKTISSIKGSAYLPKRGDVIVFHKPDGSTDQLIKRVIGLPGDRVVVKDENITVYNTEHPEGFSPDDADYGAALEPTFGNVDVTVGEHEVFVCGDNRIPGASLDSRSSLGNIDSKYIVGKLVLRYLPVGNYQTF